MRAEHPSTRPATHACEPCLGQTLKKLHRELSAANHMNALRSELKEGGGASGKEDMSISDLLRAKNLRKQVLPARGRGGEAAGRGGGGGAPRLRARRCTRPTSTARSRRSLC